MSAEKFKSFLIYFTISLTIFIGCINTASAQWVQQSTPYSSFILSVCFTNNQTGYASGYDGIVKTTNGGVNWNFTTNPGDDVTKIFFTDANTGWATSYGVSRTTNGGANWTYTSGFSGLIFAMDFINANTGWIGDAAGYIYKTTNGGTSWSPQYHNDDFIFRSINFIDANTGWTCGDQGVIMKTTNGGTNWTAQSSGTTEIIYSINFSTASNGFFCGYEVLKRTTNGGTNWVTVPGLPNDVFYDVYSLPNTSVAWASGFYGNIYCTTNNGVNWITQSPNIESGYVIHFLNSSLGCIGGNDGKIFITTTGGFNLNAPTNLTLTPSTTSAIHLSWTDNSQEDKFMIERSPNGSSGWTLIDSVGANVTTYQNTGLAYDTDYYFRVYAKKIVFTGSNSNAPRMRAKLTPPSNTSPVNDTAVVITTPTLSWSSVSGGFFYDCQIATDAAFTNVIYTRGNSAANYQPIPSGILQNSTKYYWRSKAINLITYSDYSSVSSFIVQDQNYGHNMQSGNNLYYFANSTSGASLSPSRPVYNWRDTTGSINLISGQAGTPSSGTLDDGYFLINNIFGPGNRTKFFGTDYSNVYIGTNGIISFTSYTPLNTVEPTDAGIPQANIPTAIFPFWADLNFQTPAVGSRLCYKLTSNELIITYTKAQVKAPGGALNNNLYISFQVIIVHSPSNSINSQIQILFNEAESGSDLFTRLNNNTMPRHLIGLQGSNSASQAANYRFENSSYQYPHSGPMFGSNLALQFGPDATSLPVELSSFTSQVNNSNVKLEWSTVNEQNNSGFEIERKISGSKEWKKINFVQGNGTTNEAKNYSYEDRNITSGKYQYRLKQIDFNGNYEYHGLANEVEIGVPKKFNLSQNYPNPFNPNTAISYQLSVDGFVSLKVYDIAGKEVTNLVNQNQKAGYYTVEFNGSNLASGMYFYRIQAGDYSAVKKMVLVK